MKRLLIALLTLTLAISIAAAGGPNVFGREGIVDQSTGMPARPIPSIPIPYHEPGHPSRAANYNTSVTRINAAGLEETVQLTGLDAMLADDVIDDPLQGNYKLVNLDKIMWSSYYNNNLTLETMELASPILRSVPGSSLPMGNLRFYDTAAGDLNGDLVDEQIVAFVGGYDQIQMSIGEMPGSFGRATSSPAVLFSNSTRHTFVRGYDDALWHHNDSEWQNAGGRLLSAPAAASRAAGQFDVFAVGLDEDPSPPNYLVLWQAKYDGTEWKQWEQLDIPETGWPEIERQVPTPELPAPAVVATGSRLDMFWVWPDNTLRWRHNNGASWNAAWVNLGGMLASGPGAVAHDGQLDVFARGVDDALWQRTRNGSWGSWQRVDQGGMPESVTILSAPAVISPAANQLLVTVRGSDDQLWQLAYNGSSWGDWQSASLDKSTEGQVGGAVALDGVDDYVDLTDNFPTVEDFTFAAWVYWKGGADWQRIFDFGQDTDSYMFLTPQNFYTNKMRFVIKAKGEPEKILDASMALPPNQWVHVAVTLKEDRAALYINGQLDEDKTGFGTNPADVAGENSWLGKSQYAPDKNFEGYLDEVTVFGRALTTAEITKAMNSEWDKLDGQIMRLEMDESPASHGVSLFDASKASNEGTLYTFEGSKFTGAPALTKHDGPVELFALTTDGHVRQGSYNGSSWTDWMSFSGLPVLKTYPLEDATTVTLTGNETIENWMLDVETGHFTGDGREQIVLAYQSTGGIRIEIYDSKDGFVPHKLAEVETSISGWVPKIAAGDVDGDGVDEIGLVYILGDRPDPINPVNDHYKFMVFQLAGDPNKQYLSVYSTSSNRCVKAKHDPVTCRKFAGTLQIAAGDIVPKDNNEEFVVLSDWWKHGAYHDLTADMFLYDADSENEDKIEDIDNNTIFATDDFYDGHVYTGLGLAVGNVSEQTGDRGIDEIVVTWPWEFDGGDWPDLRRYLRVYSLDSSYKNTYIERKIESPYYSNASYLDTLAVGDLNQDLKDEIVLAGKNVDPSFSQPYYLIAFGVGNDNKFYQASDHAYIPLTNPRGFNLVTGDFTGESQRLGPPSYRRQYAVGKVIAIVNAPPKHKDTVDGEPHNLNADDENTYAQYYQKESESNEVSVTTQKDWGVDSEFTSTIGDPEGTHTKTSIENSYGENFSNTEGSTKEMTLQSQYSASSDDVLYYTRLDYDVWEYPVYDRLTFEPQGHLSVVWPHGKMEDLVEPANVCDGWYRPNHQLMNVWSYPKEENQLLGRETDGSRDLLDLPKYTVGVGKQNFSVNFSDQRVQHKTESSELSFAASFEKQIGGDKIGFEFAGLSFETRMPALYFSSSGHYSSSDLSEWTTVTTDETKLSGFFEPIPNGNAYLYKVKPYLYWSTSKTDETNDYLVLNYLTDPTNQLFWSSSGNIYNRPDPAFIRPWAERQCDHAWDDAIFFSSDITIDPPMARTGETVAITAKIHNFSEVGNGSAPFRQPFTVSFYQGDPDSGGTLIKPITIAAGALKPRAEQAVLTRSIEWVAQGSGEQHIYAVIDRAGDLEEVHDEKDPDETNNNKGYGVLSLDRLEFIDVGRAAEEAYHEVELPLGAGAAGNSADTLMGESSPSYSIHVPLAAATANLRVDLRGAVGFEDWTVLGLPVTIDVYQTDWEDPEPAFSFTPEDGDAPAVITVDYAGVNLVGWDENKLTLYWYTGGGWELANHGCEMDGAEPVYKVQRFKDQDLLAVPVCQTGVFAVSDKLPTQLDPVYQHLYLPVVLKK